MSMIKKKIACHAKALLIGGVMYAASGCHGILPRTGKLFLSTRAPLEENNGYFLCWMGNALLQEGIPLGFIFLVPGIAVGVLDQCVFSPVWDVLCIPADLTMPMGRLRIVDSSGEPIRNAIVNYTYKSGDDGRVVFRLKRRCGDTAVFWINASGYVGSKVYVSRDGKEQTVVLLTEEEENERTRQEGRDGEPCR